MNNEKCVRSFFHQTESKTANKKNFWMHFTFRSNLRTECVEISENFIFRKISKGFREKNAAKFAT